jgi:hypothetical protein
MNNTVYYNMLVFKTRAKLQWSFHRIPRLPAGQQGGLHEDAQVREHLHPEHPHEIRPQARAQLCSATHRPLSGNYSFLLIFLHIKSLFVVTGIFQNNDLCNLYLDPMKNNQSK